jgi:hypothetical protein
MNLHNVTHSEHEQAYMNGFETMVKEIECMGWVASRDKFNIENPIDVKYSSLSAYYYSKGGIDALMEKK